MVADTQKKIKAFNKQQKFIFSDYMISSTINNCNSNRWIKHTGAKEQKGGQNTDSWQE